MKRALICATVLTSILIFKGYRSFAAPISLKDYSLLPLPQEITFGDHFVTVEGLSLNSPCWNDVIAEIFNGVPFDNGTRSALPFICMLDTASVYGDAINDEAYSLKIAPERIELRAPSKRGLYWGLMTLQQLLKTDEYGRLTLPECDITDWPAFSIRGFMMDCGRSYISVAELKDEIAAMSKFKLNTFHWHFTENQAWRLQSKVFPQLNDSVNMTRQPGRFYTIEEARDIMKWAAAHNITLIPEIDMPGHSAAFERTFGFAMQTPEGMAVLKQLVDEACEIFDEVPYFHIGTDEVKFTNSDFVPEMVELVRNHGKKAISWNPGWKYQPGEIDMVQMWSYRGRPLEGVPTVDSRFHYINHFDTYADMVALYRSNVYHETKETDNIKGMILALWNDRLVDNEEELVAQNGLYPLLLATAERSWDGGGYEYFDSLGTNMPDINTDDFKQFTDFERRLLYHKATTLRDKKIPYVKQTNVNWLITEAFPNNGDLAASFPPEKEGPKLEYVYNDSVYKSREATGAGIYLRHVWGEMVPAFYSKPLPNHTAYAFTNVYSPIDQEVGLQVETQNYSRSESDLPPRQGKWDYRESRIFVNGNELTAPGWTAKHTERSNEITLGNENMAAREPLKVKLHKGWNTVMLKLPVGVFNTPETRLVKWMFTFVFTTPDGKEAAPDLIYSPLLPEE